MMNMVRRILNALIQTAFIRQGVFPTSADTVAALAIVLTKNAAAWTWGAWAQIVAAAGVTADTLITGFTLENPSNPVSTIQGEVQIGIGGAGAEAAVGTFPIAAPLFILPKPRWVGSGVRVAARFRSSSAAADTIDVKLLTTTGF